MLDLLLKYSREKIKEARGQNLQLYFKNQVHFEVVILIDKELHNLALSYVGFANSTHAFPSHNILPSQNYNCHHSGSPIFQTTKYAFEFWSAFGKINL